MSIHIDRKAWRVRYRDASGRQRSRTFTRKADADLFDREVKRAKQLRGAFTQIEVTLPSAKPTRVASTNVYIVAGADKVKIGIADKPKRRLLDMRGGSPVPLTLVRTIPTDRAAELEAALHERYREHHSHGEWFNAEPVLADLAALTDDDLAAMLGAAA